MNFKIEQHQLNSIIDKFVRNIYGEKLKMYVNDENYTYFYYGDYDPSYGHDRTYTPIHKNSYGTLWIDDLSLPKTISSFMSVSPSESMEIIAKYISSKYNISVKSWGNESYDPWLD